MAYFDVTPPPQRPLMKYTAYVGICAKIRLMNAVATLLHNITCQLCIFRQYFHFKSSLFFFSLEV